jgi:glucose-1-phosphate adenylyltransferase
MNSGLTQVGVLTQYKPLSLMRHISRGEAWDFTGRTRGVKILPPSTGFKDSDWYKGTADAVRQNLNYITSHPSKEVLILSGDHIYRLDFHRMIQFHRRKKADITIGMMKVDMSEIHQFGTGILDHEERIIEWEEKPEVPRTDLASMGIYVFDTEYLLALLAENKEEIDFGMHLIPKAIARDNVFAFPFQGYWRDVGTVQAYWEANMDVLREDSGISPEKWGIRPNIDADQLPFDRCPARFAKGCEVKKSLISADCVIEGTVINSVLSPGVIVKPGAVVRDSIIFHDGVIEANAKIDLAILDKRVNIGKGAVIGNGDQKDTPNRLYPKHLYTGITMIGKEAVVPPKAIIGRNCIVHPYRKLDDFFGLTVKDGETI